MPLMVCVGEMRSKMDWSGSIVHLYMLTSALTSLVPRDSAIGCSWRKSVAPPKSYLSGIDNCTQFKSAMFDKFIAMCIQLHYINRASSTGKWSYRKWRANLQADSETDGSIRCSYDLSWIPYPSHWKCTIIGNHGKTDMYYSDNN